MFGSELRQLTQPAAYVLEPSWATAWDGSMTVDGDATGSGWLDTGCYCT